MNFELNWNEWWREDVWRPYIRIGTAMLSSAVVLASVQSTEPVYLNGTMIPRTDYQASVLSMDTLESDLLKMAVKTALETKTEESVAFFPVEDTTEKVTPESIVEKTDITKIIEKTDGERLRLETAPKVEKSNESTVSAAVAVPDFPENEKETENIQEIVSIEREDETISDEDRAAGNDMVPAERTDTGYLINDAGIIYGISENQEIVEDGVLVLPAEGCCGIAKGAFSALGDRVEEIEIPANITEIQPGAFAGLSELGWIESEETNPSYSSMDGALYTADGTGLIAFPSAWTGTFQVPEGVRYFAENAFDGTNLDCIDARACALEQTGKLPETVELLQ